MNLFFMGVESRLALASHAKTGTCASCSHLLQHQLFVFNLQFAKQHLQERYGLCGAGQASRQRLRRAESSTSQHMRTPSGWFCASSVTTRFSKTCTSYLGETGRAAAQLGKRRSTITCGQQQPCEWKTHRVM